MSESATDSRKVAPGRTTRAASEFFSSGALLGIFIVALLLRLFAIRDKFLWFDEFLTANLARNSWATILGAVRAEAHPPLYFVAMKVWAAFFGDGPVAMKSVSLLCGMGALVLFADAVRRALGFGASAVSALLFGLSTVQIDQSTDAKPYAMLTLFLALELWAFVRADREPGRKGFFALAVASAIAAGSTHFYGTAAAPAVAFAALLAARDRRGRGRAAAVLVASAAVTLLWVPSAMRLPRGSADYIREIWGRVPRWAPLAVSTRISLPGWRKPYPPMDGTILPSVSAREIVAGLLVLAILSWRTATRSGDEPESSGARFLFATGLLLFFGFLLLETVANLLDRPIGLPGRFEVATGIGLALLAARAVSPSRRAAWIFGIPLAAVCLVTVVPQWRLRAGPRPIRREELIVREIRRRLSPGQFANVVTLGLARPPLDYYAAGDPRIRMVSFPSSQQAHIGWRASSIAPGEEESLRAEAERLVAFLDQELARGVAVYVAARPDRRNEFLLSLLQKDHELVGSPLADWFFAVAPSRIRLATAGAGNLSPGPVSPLPKEALWDADGDFQSCS